MIPSMFLYMFSWHICLLLPSSGTASPVSGRLLLRSLGTIGFRDVIHPCDVTEINLAVNDRAHGERKRSSN